MQHQTLGFLYIYYAYMYYARLQMKDPVSLY